MSTTNWCPKCLGSEFQSVKVRYDPATGVIINKPGLFDSAAKKEAYQKAPEGNGYHCSKSTCDYTWTPADIVANIPNVPFPQMPAISWGKPLKRTPQADMATRSLPPNLQQLIEWLATGTEAQMLPALKQLSEGKPREAVPALVQIANGRTTQLEERQLLATALLGDIGDASAVQGLVEGGLSFQGRVPVVCLTLGQIGHPSAIPYLCKIAKEDSPLEDQKADVYQKRAYALIALAMIGHANAFSSLIEDAKLELNSFIYHAPSNLNAMMFDKSVAWRLVGLAAAAMDHRAANKWKTQNAALMTHPEIPLEMVVQAPPEVRRMWLFHLRLAVLNELVAACGVEALRASWPKAKESIQKLMIALPILAAGSTDQQWLDCLGISIRSKHLSERLITYEACVQLAVKTGAANYTQWAQAGLQDRDKQVQAGVAAAILYYQLPALIPQALELTQSKSADIRASMVAPVAMLAQSGDSRGAAALAVLKGDRDKQVREAVELWI